MRIIESSYVPSDGVSPEESERVLEAVASGVTVRASEASDRYGSVDAYLRIVAFTGPLGDGRWAVVAVDPQGSETADTDDEREAVAAYEEQVRDLAGCQAAGTGPWWDRSDVSGVPFGAYTCQIEYRLDGTWTESGQWGGTREERLGRSTALLLDDAPLTLEVAVGETSRAAARTQNLLNRMWALARATGTSGPLAMEADAVRVTVSGTGEEGPVEHTDTVETPACEPTPDDIAAYLRGWERSDDGDPYDPSCEDEHTAY